MSTDKWFRYISESNLVKIREMLEDGLLSINTKDSYVMSAINHASNRNLIELMRLLIEFNADLNSTNLFGETPLITASSNGYYDIAKLLLENGANVNLQDRNGYNAIGSALINHHDDIVELLLDYNANFDNEGMNTINLAIFDEDINFFTLLMKRGISLFNLNRDGRLIHRGLRNYKKDIVDFFYNQGLPFEPLKCENFSSISPDIHDYFQDYEGYREFRIFNEEEK